MSLLIFGPWCHSCWPDQTRSHSDSKLDAGLFNTLYSVYAWRYTIVKIISQTVGVGLGNMVLHRILFSNRPSFASPRSKGSVFTQAERQNRLDDMKDPLIIEDRWTYWHSDKHAVRKFITCCKAKLTVRRRLQMSSFLLRSFRCLRKSNTNIAA